MLKKKAQAFLSFIDNCQLYIVKRGVFMIEVTGMNQQKFILNADHIEKIEEMPETIITLTNGKKYIVLESIDEVKNEVIQYKNKIFTYNI